MTTETRGPMFKGVISDVRKPIQGKPDFRWPVLEGMWTVADNKRAYEEGWCLTANGPPIWYIAPAGVAFASAEDAQRWVGEQADGGSEFHVRANATVLALTMKGEDLWKTIKR